MTGTNTAENSEGVLANTLTIGNVLEDSTPDGVMLVTGNIAVNGVTTEGLAVDVSTIIVLISGNVCISEAITG